MKDQARPSWSWFGRAASRAVDVAQERANGKGSLVNYWILFSNSVGYARTVFVFEFL
jgi:hypothetical protein